MANAEDENAFPFGTTQLGLGICSLVVCVNRSFLESETVKERLALVKERIALFVRFKRATRAIFSFALGLKRGRVG